MKDRINRQSEAFREALDYCKILGLDWHHHVYPKIEKRAGIDEITGFYVLDETRSTTVKTVMI